MKKSKDPCSRSFFGEACLTNHKSFSKVKYRITNNSSNMKTQTIKIREITVIRVRDKGNNYKNKNLGILGIRMKRMNKKHLIITIWIKECSSTKM